MNATEERFDRYEVRLESDSAASKGQSRLIALDAPSSDVARQMAADRELKIVDFSLEIPSKETWELPRHYHVDEPDTGAHVNLSRWDAHDAKWSRWAAELPYDEAKSAARERLSTFSSGIEVDKRGKVKGRRLTARQTARFMAHAQQEPYNVVDVRKVDPAEIERQRVVSALAQMTADPDGWALEIEKLKKDGPVAVVTAALYGLPWQKQIDGSGTQMVFSSDTIKNALCTAYTADVDTHDFWDDVVSTEISGTGYTTLGVTAASKASTYDTATDQIRLDWADVSWTTSTLSATDLVIFKSTGTAGTSPLWGNVDFGATVTTTAGTFLVTFDATGVVVYDIT